MLRNLLISSAACVLALAGVCRAEAPPHPRLRSALYELLAARREVKDSRFDFGGHRAKALSAIDDAITSLKTILRVKSDDVPGVDRNKEFYKAFKDYPRLRQAQRDLREARDYLKASKTDFGGLKKRALQDISRAHEQIERLLATVRTRR